MEAKSRLEERQNHATCEKLESGNLSDAQVPVEPITAITELMQELSKFFTAYLDCTKLLFWEGRIRFESAKKMLLVFIIEIVLVCVLSLFSSFYIFEAISSLISNLFMIETVYSKGIIGSVLLVSLACILKVRNLRKSYAFIRGLREEFSVQEPKVKTQVSREAC